MAAKVKELIFLENSLKLKNYFRFLGWDTTLESIDFNIFLSH